MLVPSIFNDSLFNDFFEFPFIDDRAERRAERKLYGHHAANLMKTDIREQDNGYQLEIDLPGFKKEEIQVELKNGYLTVSAEKGLDEDKKSGRYLRQERYAGACQRSFYVGEDVTQEEIKAQFHHGILELFVPKKEAKQPEEKKNYISIE